MDDLTRRQRQVLTFIRRYMKQQQRSPTLREIAEAMEIGTTEGVMAHLRPLERKRYIARQPDTNRGIRLLGNVCPFCGGER